MNIYLTHKQSTSKIEINKENAKELIKDGYKIVIFVVKKEVDDIIGYSEAFIFQAGEYYGDIIESELYGEKTTKSNGIRSRNKENKAKEYIYSGVIDLSGNGDEVVKENQITKMADKRYGNGEKNKTYDFAFKYKTKLIIKELLQNI